MRSRLQPGLLLAFFCTAFGFSETRPPKVPPTSNNAQPCSQAVDFDRQIALPPAVLKALLKEVGTDIRRATDFQQTHPDQLFGATLVHLGPSHETDFIVFGLPPFCGVSFDWYWVVRARPRKTKVVLSTIGNCVEVLATRTHQLLDIETIGGTLWERHDDVYQFNGIKYKLWRRKTVTLNPQ